MSVAEKLAVLAGGRSVNMARPSREQREVMERLERIMKLSRKEYRERQRQRQYTDPKAKESRRLSPLTGDSYSHQHGKQDRGSNYSSLGQDLLAAMHGCSQLGTAVVLVKYAQDRSSQSKAFYALYDRVVELFVSRGWRCSTEEKGKEIMRSMCQIAILEANDPKCEKCRGAGVGARQGQCRVCGGSGNLKIDDQDRAIAIGVSKQSYRATHKQRYQAVLELVRTAEESTLRTMKKRLTP